MATADETTEPEALSGSLKRNIGILAEHRRQHVARASAHERVASRITEFIGSMWFVYLHLLG